MNQHRYDDLIQMRNKLTILYETFTDASTRQSIYDELAEVEREIARCRPVTYPTHAVKSYVGDYYH